MILLQAHNFIEVFSEGQVARHFCEEECILYSGNLLTHENKIMVLSGTVFREVLLW